MMIAVLANDEQWKELNQDTSNVNLLRIQSLQQVNMPVHGYIILQEINTQQLKNIQVPVLLNSVIATLKELNIQPNVVRINGWNSFIARKIWEVAGIITDEVKQIFSLLDKQYIEATDEPGLVAARPIAMIINEAYFALEDEISSKREIDIAMKLGTNYPYGPFEWASIIGVKNVYGLLFALSQHDKRYLPASLLQKEAAI